MRLFAADLHLRADKPERLQSFLAALNGEARRAKELYLLGDIFDAWPGDDENGETAAAACRGMAALAQSGVAVYIQRGNRDFLLGKRFCRRAGCRMLSDLHVLECGGRRFLLAHGDLFCGDKKYLRWRKIVRSGVFAVFARCLPLSARRRAAAFLRGQSQKRRRPAELSPERAAAALRKYRCGALIHGHAHAAGETEWEDGGARFVRRCLPDWETAPGAFVRMDDAGAVFDGAVKLQQNGANFSAKTN